MATNTKTRSDAEQARRLLEDTFFNEALKEYERDIVEKWIKCSPTEDAVLKELHHTIRAARGFKAKLGKFILAEKMAEKMGGKNANQ